MVGAIGAVGGRVEGVHEVASAAQAAHAGETISELLARDRTPVTTAARRAGRPKPSRRSVREHACTQLGAWTTPALDPDDYPEPVRHRPQALEVVLAPLHRSRCSRGRGGAAASYSRRARARHPISPRRDCGRWEAALQPVGATGPVGSHAVRRSSALRRDCRGRAHPRSRGRERPRLQPPGVVEVGRDHDRAPEALRTVVGQDVDGVAARHDRLPIELGQRRVLQPEEKAREAGRGPGRYRRVRRLLLSLIWSFRDASRRLRAGSRKSSFERLAGVVLQSRVRSRAAKSRSTSSSVL